MTHVQIPVVTVSALSTAVCLTRKVLVQTVPTRMITGKTIIFRAALNEIAYNTTQVLITMRSAPYGACTSVWLSEFRQLGLAIPLQCNQY